MNDKVVIAGTVKLRNTIKAKTNLHNVINGTPSWVVNTGGGGIVYPHYSGSYIVTPSSSVQTLDTSDKVMDDDVTIEAITQGSATTPATIITADPTISVSSGGLITSTVSKTQQITPTVQEGYVEEGTPGNVGVSGSNTEQLSVQGAQTIHPASTDQSIASGKYLTGNQTFKAVTVSGLTADKVLQGNVIKIGDEDDDDRIMSVTGTASGGITPTGTKQIAISANGTVTEDVTDYASAEITTNVPASAVDTGTKSISSNGTHDVTGYASANVQVPNSYSSSDEGKVVSNGALVAQTSDTVTANDTYDTTLINSLTVNVSGGTGLKYETGTFTLESDVTLNASKPNQSIPHTLGIVPDVVVVTYVVSNGTVTSNKGYIWMDRIIDLDQRLTTSVKNENSLFVVIDCQQVSGVDCLTVASPTSATYTMTSAGKPTSSDFKLLRMSSSTVWSAGTYRYFVSEKWW